MEEKKKKSFNVLGTSIWRILAYFIIYSFVGFLIETIFALVFYNVLESRQSFLYGPFCGIYGVGAVVMYVILNKYFKKNKHLLFLGGFLVGSVVEYVLSFLGEILLNVRWWDYSNRFLNINGRICLVYSIFWGLLGLYLVKIANPIIDKFLDKIKDKIGIVKARTMAIVLTIFLFINCVVSGVAIDLFLTRVAIENNLEVAYKEEIQEKYNKIYIKNDKLSSFIHRHWGNEKMIKTYPNLTIGLANGESKKVKEFYPDIQYYYVKIEK